MQIPAQVDEYETRDWILEASAILLDGEIVLPEPGDRLTIPSTGVQWETMTPAYRPADAAGLVLRLRTRLIDAG